MAKEIIWIQLEWYVISEPFYLLLLLGLLFWPLQRPPTGWISVGHFNPAMSALLMVWLYCRSSWQLELAMFVCGEFVGPPEPWLGMWTDQTNRRALQDELLKSSGGLDCGRPKRAVIITCFIVMIYRAVLFGCRE